MQEEYKARRKRLSDSLPGQSILIAGHAATQMRADAAYDFVQDANFLYLTGINEPGWELVFDAPHDEFILVAPLISEQQRLFDGALSHELVRRSSAIEKVIEKAQAKKVLEGIRSETDTIYTIGSHPHQKYYNFEVNPAQATLTRRLKRLFKNIGDCRAQLTKLRAIKSNKEIHLMKEAVAVSLQGFEKLKVSLDSAKNEYELEAILNSEFRRTGANGHAYSPIVASGAHSCTLHYSHNSDTLPLDGLVLIDAGAKVGEYAADITRTFAIGAPSTRQLDVHAAVEFAHHEIIALVKPGVSIESYQDRVDGIMKQALEKIGLFKKDSDYRKYFPHAISHGLGIDVHESLGGYKEFQPGMVLTVEPGIYIPEEGIGVRIEDDILVTTTGNENLSAALPTSL